MILSRIVNFVTRLRSSYRQGVKRNHTGWHYYVNLEWKGQWFGDIFVAESRRSVLSIYPRSKAKRCVFRLNMDVIDGAVILSKRRGWIPHQSPTFKRQNKYFYRFGSVTFYCKQNSWSAYFRRGMNLA